ncbi:MAG: urease accessory protein [Candidatus Binatia bacterium]
MLTILLLGFLLGVRHALEADHVAAVASLATRSAALAEKIKVAAFWGGGHAVSLVLLGAILIGLGVSMPERLARAFELAAGVVLVVLGIDVLRRLRRRQIHFHVHQHVGGVRHLHAHAHAGESPTALAVHEHPHARGVLLRSLAIGGLHGLAGSGALVLLSLQMLGSGAQALAYVFCFAAGSIMGMVAFSLVLSVPLTVSPRLLERMAGKLEAVLGMVTISVGCWMAVRAAVF